MSQSKKEMFYITVIVVCLSAAILMAVYLIHTNSWPLAQATPTPEARLLTGTAMVTALPTNPPISTATPAPTGVSLFDALNMND